MVLRLLVEKNNVHNEDYYTFVQLETTFSLHKSKKMAEHCEQKSGPVPRGVPRSLDLSMALGLSLGDRCKSLCQQIKRMS